MISPENFEVNTLDLPNFDGVVGMTNLKNDLRVTMIEPLRNPALFEELGLSAGEKYLLYGPPGCGKSYFARSVAGELRSRCFELIPSTTIGQGYDAVNVVATVFTQARFVRPSVVIIDEVETLTRDRDSIQYAEFLRAFLNEMLIQFDNTRNDNTKVVVLGTTNAPWHVDGAFLREGRFGRAVLVPPPTKEERQSFFRKLLSLQNFSDKILSELAGRTRLFSYADLSGVVKKTRQEGVKALISQGKSPRGLDDVPVTVESLTSAIELQFSPTKAWFEKFESHAIDLHDSLLKPVQEYLRAEKKE